MRPFWDARHQTQHVRVAYPFSVVVCCASANLLFARSIKRASTLPFTTRMRCLPPLRRKSARKQDLLTAKVDGQERTVPQASRRE